MSKAHLLVVEDEPLIQEILIENLRDAGYDVTYASTGQEAWDLIQAGKQIFDTIILDRLMPGMDGIEILHRIAQYPELMHVPVVMQTSLTSESDIAEGLRAGAYYYLTKPFAAEQLLAIVGHAVATRQRYLELQAEISQTTNSLQLLDNAVFHFRTREDAKALAALVAQATPEPQRTVQGLSELMLNAVEHGNLQITYQEKTDLLKAGRFEEEVKNRLATPFFGQRQARLTLERNASNIRFIIRDEGDGFDWTDYLEFSPERAFDLHGRGIAMARLMSFDSLNYLGNGNAVMVAVTLEADAPTIA